MDPLQWMGAVRMGVQTADKNITIIHTSPVHQLTSKVKNCVFVRNNSIIDFKLLLWAKIQVLYLQYCILVLSESEEKLRTVYKWKQSTAALNKYVGGFWCEKEQDNGFLTGGGVIMDYGLLF